MEFDRRFAKRELPTGCSTVLELTEEQWSSSLENAWFSPGSAESASDARRKITRGASGSMVTRWVWVAPVPARDYLLQVGKLGVVRVVRKTD